MEYNGSLAKRLRQYLSLPNLCGLLLAAVIGLFYSAKLTQAAPISTAGIPGGFSLAFAPDSQARLIGLVLMLLFCLLEFGLYGLLIWVVKPDWDRKTRVLFATSLMCLSLIPLYRFGGVNDFVMRASIPALYVLAVFVSRALHSQSSHRLARIFLIVLVLLGSVTAVIEFRRHLVGMVEAGEILQVPRIEQVMSVSEWGVVTERDATIVLQYIGSSSAPFFEFLAKEP